jgi:hypothetical protein
MGIQPRTYRGKFGGMSIFANSVVLGANIGAISLDTRIHAIVDALIDPKENSNSYKVESRTISGRAAREVRTSVKFQGVTLEAWALVVETDRGFDQLTLTFYPGMDLEPVADRMLSSVEYPVHTPVATGQDATTPWKTTEANGLRFETPAAIELTDIPMSAAQRAQYKRIATRNQTFQGNLGTLYVSVAWTQLKPNIPFSLKRTIRAGVEQIARAAQATPDYEIEDCVISGRPSFQVRTTMDSNGTPVGVWTEFTQLGDRYAQLTITFDPGPENERIAERIFSSFEFK